MLNNREFTGKFSVFYTFFGSPNQPKPPEIRHFYPYQVTKAQKLTGNLISGISETNST
jgi:hypothetical protein